MLYLRNTSDTDQWLEDPQTGIRRRVAPEALARVTTEMAEHALKATPNIWQLETPITLPPPSP